MKRVIKSWMLFLLTLPVSRRHAAVYLKLIVVLIGSSALSGCAGKPDDKTVDTKNDTMRVTCYEPVVVQDTAQKDSVLIEN